MKSIRPDELSKAILGIVKEYRQDVADGLKREVNAGMIFATTPRVNRENMPIAGAIT